MIHFFPHFSRDAADTEFGRALRRIGFAHRIIASSFSFHYRTRIQLFGVLYPRFAILTLRNAIISLVLSRPRPTAVILGTDIEVLIFAFMRAVMFRRNVKIILSSFIYTSRPSKAATKMRELYFRLVLSQVSTAIVHSTSEVPRYQRLFSGLRVKFCFVPWATIVEKRDEFMGAVEYLPGTSGQLVSAGRSGRDFKTLFRAIEPLNVHLRIICDFLTEKTNPQVKERVTVLSNCYGDDYFKELVRAEMVVIPLSVADISAGQMVAVQSMALGKPIIITDTPTVRDYVNHDRDGILVPLGDHLALREAISKLAGNPSERERLGRNAYNTFRNRLTPEMFFRGVIAAAGE